MNEEDNLILLVGRIDGKLDSLITSSASATATQEALEKRVGALEHWQAAAVAVVSVVATTFGAVAGWVVTKWHS